MSQLPLKNIPSFFAGQTVNTPSFLIRDATEADLPQIAEFEVQIAIISFAESAITDRALHRKRVSSALGKQGEIQLVSVASDDPAVLLGWGWVSQRTNSLTGDRYGNFRSLAVADHPERGRIADELLDTLLHRAQDLGLTELVGKVHSRNIGMRVLYASHGFEAESLTMRRSVKRSLTC